MKPENSTLSYSFRGFKVCRVEAEVTEHYKTRSGNQIND